MVMLDEQGGKEEMNNINATSLDVEVSTFCCSLSMAKSGRDWFSLKSHP